MMTTRLFLTRVPGFMKRDVIEIAESAIHQEGATSPLDEDPAEDVTDREGIIDYSEIIAESAFLGEMPFAEILKGINDQFADYINMEDTTNYVDLFYTQMDASFAALNNDNEEEHPQEIRDILNKLKSEFESTISILFETRLTITIMATDDETTEDDEVELVIRKLYEYFILGAKDDFIKVISKSIVPKVGAVSNDDAYYQRIEALLSEYDPLVTCMTPVEFIQCTGDDDIIAMYEDGQVVGNFLRKYSAKLYKNEDFKIDVISAITMIQDMKEDIINGEQSATN